MKSEQSAGSARAMIGGLLIAAGCVLAPDAAGFESEVWAGSLPASSAAITVNWSEVGPIEALPATVGGWVLISYARSVDCSPPRACYASSQRVYVYAYCSIGAIKDIQRVSMDLNGNIVAQTGERAAYIPIPGSVDRAVMLTLCEAYGFYYRRWWPGRGADSDTE